MPAVATAGARQAPRGRWGTCGTYMKSIAFFLISHIGLVSMVAGYCVIGAFTFEALEADNELEVKRNVSQIRGNVTSSIWTLTQEQPVLREKNWTDMVGGTLKEFEVSLIRAMKTKGWDGSEDLKHQQWTFGGALFYSIVVITTIGYGHIAPKTDWGKVVTMLYAILGIPLMCLCLSNISEGMAHSFKVIYWKCCCYLCTKKPKRRRRRPIRSRRGTSNSRTVRRPERTTTDGGASESAASCLDPARTEQTNRSVKSDREFRVADDLETGGEKNSSNIVQPDQKPVAEAAADGKQADTDHVQASVPTAGGGAAPKRHALHVEESPREAATPRELSSGSGDSSRQLTVSASNSAMARRADSGYGRSVSSGPRSMETTSFRPGKASETCYVEDEAVVEHDLYDDSDDEDAAQTKSVPIWLCVLLVVSYIVGGAYLFRQREKWTFLDSAYFCFITLTTIGFGDFVPDQRSSGRESDAIAICSFYLLFGIALLMMSFNLVQEEVINSVKGVAKKLGIIKDEDEEYDDY